MRRRLLGGFFVAFFLVMSFSVDAYADDPSIANPACQKVYVSQNDYLVYPVSNRFDATLVLLGAWYTKIQITQDMYVKLSNPESGGRFYELASHFFNGYDPPSWSDDATNPMGFLYWLNSWTYVAWNIGEPWEDFTWWVHAEDYEIDQARADLQTILDGGSLGSPGGGSSGNYYDFNAGVYYVSSSSNNVGSTSCVIAADGTRYYRNVYQGNLTGHAVFPQGFLLRVDKSLISGDHTFDGARIEFSTGGTVTGIVLYKGTVSEANNTLTVGGQLYSDSKYVSSISYSDRAYLTSNLYDCVFDGTVMTVTPKDGVNPVGVTSFNPNGNISINYLYGDIMFTASGGGGGGGDNHWPDPVLPNPPDPPDPNPEPDPDPPDPGPGIDLPDVDFPDITIEGSSSSVSFPTINVESPSITVNPPTNTSSADYTPWLSAILSALNSIIADLDSHCQHLRQAIRDYSQSLANSINASMDSHCQHLRQAIKDYAEALASSVHDDMEYFYNDLTAYLAELAQWLVEHLNWSVDVQSPDVNLPSFDDSGIVAWLKRIYLKLGGTSYPKPDPVTNPDDALDWWSALLRWIANALSGFITTFVGDVGAVVEGVLTRFPFSIPWDILAYLTLLDAERVTPVIVVTVPAVTGWWSQFSVTIDLSAYNLAMATVRSMMLVWWGFILVMRTDWILLIMGRTGAELATGFVSRLVGNGGD